MEQPERPWVRMFIGAAGGDGTTTATVLAAMRARSDGHDVVVVDPRGDVATMLGVPSDRRHGLYAAVHRCQGAYVPDTMLDCLNELRPRLRLLSSVDVPRGTARGVWMSGRQDEHEALLDVAIAEGIAVLIDGGDARSANMHGWMRVLEAPNRVLVSTNRTHSIDRARALIEVDVADTLLLNLDDRHPLDVEDVSQKWGRSPDAVIGLDPELTRAGEVGLLLDRDSPELSARLTAVIDTLPSPNLPATKRRGSEADEPCLDAEASGTGQFGLAGLP